MLKQLTTLITLITIYTKHSEGFCIPCPRDGVTFSTFQECNCPLGTFFNEPTKACVPYFECPLPPYRNPLPEIKAFSPLLHDLLSHALSAFNSSSRAPSDLHLVFSVLKKRFQEVKKSVPALMAPIVGSVMAKNADLFEVCAGNFVCVIREALKRENNYDLIFPKLRSALDEVIKKFHGVFDDLKALAADKSCEKGCPLIKGLIRWKEVFPDNLQETLDVMQIIRQIRTYLLKDLRRRLDSLIKA